MGPRLRDSPSSCSFPFPEPGASLWSCSASRCRRWGDDAVAQRPVSPAQQPPSHGRLCPDPSQSEPLVSYNPGSSGPCTPSFARKLRSPPAQLLPPEPDDTFWGAPCEQPLERRYQALPALVCIMCCLFGVVYCFFGYRCFKAVLFLTGLLFGSVVIFLLCYRERVLETQLSAGASAGIALGIGLLCGLVAMLTILLNCYCWGATWWSDCGLHLCLPSAGGAGPCWHSGLYLA